MKFYRTGLNKNQRGFTLIELLITLAIVALVAGLLATVVFQIFVINSENSSRMLTVKQLESAMHWLNRDVEMTQTVEVGDENGFPLELSWTEWDNTVRLVTYSIVDNELKRVYYTGEGEDQVLESSAIIARYIDIDADLTNCQFDDGLFTVKMTSSINGFRPVSETRELQVVTRSTQR
jgi:prepilin-type N-terminal cleavage/methylation domain-containing protein